MTGRCCDYETDVQCARCGSSLGFEDCELCPATGHYDTPDPLCEACHGTGHVPWCCSTVEYCDSNPRPGREDVKRHTPEWFHLHQTGCPGGKTVTYA